MIKNNDVIFKISLQCSHKVLWISVCDGTQNFKRYRYTDTFFPVPNISDTDAGTLFDTKFVRYRFRDFFRHQIFPILVLIPPENFRYPL